MKKLKYGKIYYGGIIGTDKAVLIYYNIGIKYYVYLDGKIRISHPYNYIILDEYFSEKTIEYNMRCKTEDINELYINVYNYVKGTKREKENFHFLRTLYKKLYGI